MSIAASGQMLGRALGSRFRLVLFFACTWLGIALLLVFLLYAGRREAERQAPADAMGIASLLEARLAGVMRRLHGDLHHLAQSLPGEAFSRSAAAPYREMVANELALFTGQFPEVSSFLVIDAVGHVLSATGDAPRSSVLVDGANRAAAGLKSGDSLLFSEVLADPASGRSFLLVIQPVRDGDGGLRGLLVAPLDMAVLDKIFATIDVGTQGVVAIGRADDGRLILRRPAQPDLVNQRVPDDPLLRRIVAGEQRGTFSGGAALDGVERVYAFQRIADYPLYVASGLAVDDYLAEWLRTLGVAAVSALLLFLALSLVLIRLLRAENEEAAIARRLAESEARYRMLADNSHDVIWTLDIPSRRYTYLSPSVFAMSGYQPEELLGQPIAATLSADVAEWLEREIDQRLRRMAAGDMAASVVVNELEQFCKDGSVITTEVVASYLCDAEGLAQTILGITRDISARKAAERALHETNRQLQTRIDEIGRLQVALQELAVRDSLTGLYNRRYLDETLDREISRAQREGAALALVMLDIDNFKQVNDRHGHQLGDEALRRLAAALMSDIRTEDMACRYGGEEFLVLLPNMPLAAALERAEAWRQTVEAMVLETGLGPLRLTISLGVAAYPEHGRLPDELTRCADLALYRAKNEGRNRVCAFSI